MAFTYDLSSPDTDKLAISQVRLELGDTVPNVGVKPDGTNFQDEELLHWIVEEDYDIGHAVGRACDALSRLWTNITNITVGPRREEFSTIAKSWSDRARQTLPVASGSDYAVTVTRVNSAHDPYKYLPEDETGL